MTTNCITVTVGESGFGGGPLSVPVTGFDGVTSVDLADVNTGRLMTAQLSRTEGETAIEWIENPLDKGSRKSYEIRPRERATHMGGVRFHESDGLLDIVVNGRLFTTYYHGADVARPYFHPLLEPGGRSLTREFPMVADAPGETSDHPHHRGFWTAYGEVNDSDNWSELNGHGRTIHRGFELIEQGTISGRVVALGDWTDADGQVLLSERRGLTIYAANPHILMDIDLTLTAAGEDVEFGDTKEGGFVSVRVATSMDVPRGGRIENSEGSVGEEDIWGKRATWCDYSGTVTGKMVGIALFDHADNVGHPTYWHARNYGLMTANPFGRSTFEEGADPGGYTLAAGDSLRLRYRAHIHQGDATVGRVADRYAGYATPPLVEAS
jgi:hypothetical protein